MGARERFARRRAGERVEVNGLGVGAPLVPGHPL
jgi:hypothetical protein